MRPILKPRERWFRIANRNTAPGIIDAKVTAITKPMSVWKLKRALIAMLIGFPLVVVRIRAKTTSTHENIKQKNAVTAMPEEIWGSKNVQINRGREYPSRKAASSISLGIAEMKPCKIQIEIGRLKRQWASAIPHTEFTIPRFENNWKIGNVSTTGGVIRNAMKARNKCLSPKNDMREKA